MVLVPAWPAVGVQVKTPLGVMLAPLGGDTRLNVSVLVGRSASLAVLVTVRVLPTVSVRLVCAASTGARLISVTVTVKVLVALRVGRPLSVTTVVKTLV